MLRVEVNENDRENPEKLSPVAELTESSSHSDGIQSCSDESGGAKVSCLDGRTLHFANKGFLKNGMGLKNGFDDFYRLNEESGHMDQLARLHDLYASVSSISAKSQSHLEGKTSENSYDDWLDHFYNPGLGSTASLGILGAPDEEIRSHTSDLNSLCSEPVNIMNYNTMNSNFTKDSNCVRSNLELELNDLSSISLSDLGFRLDANNPDTANIIARSDSPVLEGIDQELAKYAKLKDLKQAYNGSVTKPLKPLLPHTLNRELDKAGLEPSLEEQRRRSDHVPDGSSNPDLNPKSSDFASSPSNSSSVGRKSLSSLKTMGKSSKNVLIPSRSPGTGQSSCGSESEDPISRNKNKDVLINEDGKSGIISSTADVAKKEMKTATVLGAKGHHHRVVLRPSSSNSENQNTKDKDLEQQTYSAKKNKVPKFSRLFGKKISRSPLKIGKESKTGKSHHSSALLNNSSNGKRTGVLPEGCPISTQAAQNDKGRNSNSRKTADKTQKAPLASSSSGSSKDLQQQQQQQSVNGTKVFDKETKKGFLSSPKNATGTPSAASKEDSKLINYYNTGKAGKRGNQANITARSYSIPSPYSFPSAPARRSSKSKNHDTSSNDSGLGHDQAERVKLRGGRGAKTLSDNEKSCQRLQKRAKHCSSGYESSLPESIESPTAADGKSPDITLKPIELTFTYPTLEPLPVVSYNDKVVDRLDARWRSEHVKVMKKHQEVLKQEMADAKDRIGADRKKWSYELHVEASGIKDKNDPAFVEAFHKETEILKKRVDACKSHVKLVTCFDVKPLDFRTFGHSPGHSNGETVEKQLDSSTVKMINNCCTTDCDHAENILLKLSESPEENESDLF